MATFVSSVYFLLSSPSPLPFPPPHLSLLKVWKWTLTPGQLTLDRQRWECTLGWQYLLSYWDAHNSTSIDLRWIGYGLPCYCALISDDKSQSKQFGLPCYCALISDDKSQSKQFWETCAYLWDVYCVNSSCKDTDPTSCLLLTDQQ